MSWKANLDRDRKAFLMHQSEVYGNFRSYMRSNDPIVRCPELDAHTSGYVLAMRFDSALTDVLADQSH